MLTKVYYKRTTLLFFIKYQKVFSLSSFKRISDVYSDRKYLQTLQYENILVFDEKQGGNFLRCEVVTACCHVLASDMTLVVYPVSLTIAYEGTH